MRAQAAGGAGRDPGTGAGVGVITYCASFIFYGPGCAAGFASPPFSCMSLGERLFLERNALKRPFARTPHHTPPRRAPAPPLHPQPTGSCTADANATHRFGETQRRHYHSHKGGIGHIKAAAPDWTDPDW